MDTEVSINFPERQLANELAYLVADKMWRDLGDDVTDGEVYNIGQSNYEAGCYALNLVGVYKQGKHYTLHKVVVPVADVRRHMRTLEIVSRQAFNELLSAFVENYVSYDGTLSGGRRSFSVHENLSKVANLLVTNGYAEKRQDGFIWTDKIGSVMKRWCIWDKDGKCREERERDAREEAATNMADTLPGVVRRKINTALKTRNHATVMDIISKHWDGVQWLTFPSVTKTRNSSASANRIDFRLLKLFIQKIEDQRIQ